MSLRPTLAAALLTAAAATVLPAAGATTTTASTTTSTSTTTATTTSTSTTTATTTSTSTTTVERGVVIECTGRLAGEDAYVSLYENSRYVNVVQVRVGEAGGSREVRDIVRAGTARASLRIDGATARVSGTVKVVGRPTRVREELDDAGQHIVSAGTHRALRTRLRLSYDGHTTALSCDNAFRYRLRVTKTPIA